MQNHYSEMVLDSDDQTPCPSLHGAWHAIALNYDTLALTPF